MSEKRKSFKAEITPDSFSQDEFDLWFTTNGYESYSRTFLLGELEALHAVIGKFLEDRASGLQVEIIDGRDS
jgi:hypothetical protein